jgi:subtilisin family serine protease
LVTVRTAHGPVAVARQVGAHPTYVYRSALNGFAASLTAGQVEALRRNPLVKNIEADSEVTIDTTELTDSYGQPWGLDRIDQRSLPLSHSYSYTGGGAGVRAYVIDTGIETSHPEFGGRALDVYDAYGGNGQDCNGHGTHVAGTIGGIAYGVAKAVKLRGVRVLNCAGSGYLSTIIAGIDWVTGHAIKPAVANMSFGGSYSSTENAAVTNLAKSGVFVAVAAGNENGNACYESPSSAPGTLTVAASNSSGQRASFSNYGGCVDLYAPGVRIKSAWLNGGVKTLDGTSMATPHVVGVAALIKGDFGDMSTSSLDSYLLSYTTSGAISGNPTGTPNRLVYKSGW